MNTETPNTFTRTRQTQKWVVSSPSVTFAGQTVLVARKGKAPIAVDLGERLTLDPADIPKRASAALYEIKDRHNLDSTRRMTFGKTGVRLTGGDELRELERILEEKQEGGECSQCGVHTITRLDEDGVCCECIGARQRDEVKREQRRLDEELHRQTAEKGSELARLISEISGTSEAPIDEAAVSAIAQVTVEKALENFHMDQPRVVIDVVKGDSVVLKKLDNAHEIMADLLLNVACGNHVYLVGPPAAGKTHIAGQVADAINRTLYTVGALLTKYEAIGYQTATGEYITTACRDAFEHGGVLLWDEVDASSPAALVALNAMLSNGEYTFPDKTVKRHKDFVVIAAGNTFGTGATREFVGRLQLDAATLDRFAFLEMGYDEAVETAIATAEFEAHGGTDQNVLIDWLATVRTARKAVEEYSLRHPVTPRAAAMGARLLARGMRKSKVFQQIIVKGAPADMVKKLKG